MTRNSRLVSFRCHNNFTPGFYSLFFDDDNLLRLAFDGPEISSVYWPGPGVISWDAGRTSYDSSRIAVLNSSGYFRSSDDFEFQASDYGTGAWRRLKMDVDGNVRLYSLDEEKRIWSVSWQAMSQPSKIHGVCGPNATGEMEQRGLVKWVREKANGDHGRKELWLEEIIDPVMKGKCDLRKMEILVQLALECLEEDNYARPTMRQVIDREASPLK
ncbi:hypothetical protein RHSIM_RhsimUnG0151600 [Rhododendron simsii]|uniref:Uncharacterized protein n=1 Tax=Rhododendron simsii TaxID=118357 RepID=A0A834G078_RHOSS|nr:hypothetical protein RHSIM_RhsimUnG0151600 [Rhododendron simsii]